MSTYFQKKREKAVGIFMKAKKDLQLIESQIAAELNYKRDERAKIEEEMAALGAELGATKSHIEKISKIFD